MIKYLSLIALIIAGCHSNIDPLNPVTPVDPVVPTDGIGRATGYIHRPGIPMVDNKAFGLAPTSVQLPKTFSWKASGLGTPIRDQGSCGSCYCFGSVQMLDGALKIYDGKDMTLSEQQCVANAGFYKCQGGYFADKVLEEGLVLDSKCPYKANGAQCPNGKPTSFDAKANKVFNLGDGKTPPTVVQLKQAILQYGVIACTVAATNAWPSFTGTGVLSGKSNNTNHIIAIDGWDGKGNWIMKNSWGEKFGNVGYALIPYGDFSICEEAAYIAFDAAPAYTKIK